MKFVDVTHRELDPNTSRGSASRTNDHRRHPCRGPSAVDGPAVYTSQSWFFDITDSVATVAEFSPKNLPPGWRPREADEGEVGFEWIQTGAGDEASIYEVVRSGQLQIGEKVKSKGRG